MNCWKAHKVIRQRRTANFKGNKSAFRSKPVWNEDSLLLSSDTKITDMIYKVIISKFVKIKISGLKPLFCYSLYYDDWHRACFWKSRGLNPIILYQIFRFDLLNINNDRTFIIFFNFWILVFSHICFLFDILLFCCIYFILATFFNN